jgi:two-component system, chemotaxis family, sensor kinase Cph1
VTFQAAPLSDCDREPIHIPGSIQPHGLLIAVDAATGRIAQASRNVAAVLGRPFASLIGAEFASLAGALGSWAEGLAGETVEARARYLRTIRIATPVGEQAFDVAAHRSRDLILLELEAIPAGEEGTTPDPILRAFVERLQGAASVEALCHLAARDVRMLTGFDRVLVYRFDESWNGTVIGEDRNGRLPSYLDLRFPASDIPAQARELYRRNRLRIIPDASYAPVPIEPASNPATGEPLDLSQSLLRSVSPVHLEYMRNMGTAASMSISVLRDGELWGLISCHNAEPRQVGLRVRDACDFLTQIFSLQLEARQRTEEANERMQLGFVQTRLLAYMAEEERFIDGLLHHDDELMALASATGAAVISGEYCWLLGDTPPEPDVRRLYDWLSVHHREDVFATDHLAAIWPEAERYADRASGVLAISISKMHASYVLWFRPEVVRTVRWGGDPHKPVAGGEEPGRLHPRKSFEIWKETVRGRSLPWTRAELDIVKELRNSVVGIVLRRAEELASLSDELQRSNKELEAFSYSVSHDLRAPFRHIVGYSELLKKSEGDRISERGRRYVETIIESALTAGTLVDSLLNFSQMGRTALRPIGIDMNALVEEVRQRLAAEASDRRIEWRIARLAPATADPIMLRLVVENLLSNALKYTRGREVARIEVGGRTEGGSLVYWVRDNGVGFDMAYVSKLFGVFQRLHRMEDFEGTGIGLANVRRIVERHGGQTWAEGALNEGAAFFFSLPSMEGAR